MPGAPHMTSFASLPAFSRTRRSRSSASCTVPGQPPGDQQDPALARQESRLGSRGQLDLTHQVRLGPPGLERTPGRRLEVDPTLGQTPPPQLVERPEHAGRADVEALHRERSVPAVPIVRRPETVRVEGRVRVGDDRPDRLAHARLVPRRVGDRLEGLRPVEHAQTLETGAGPRARARQGKRQAAVVGAPAGRPSCCSIRSSSSSVPWRTGPLNQRLPRAPTSRRRRAPMPTNQRIV